jgi:endonuclease-3
MCTENFLFKSSSVCYNERKKEPDMKEKVSAIIDVLKAHYHNPVCALHYSKDYELMIAVRLSAQCTDARVNLVTPHLFAAYPTLEAMAAAPIDHIEELVHSCGFYKHKARDIVLACQMLLSEYGGKVPDTMEALLKLPGVGRKTANLLLGDLYGVPGSVVCDTHCIRICGKLGLSEGTEPEKVERQLRAILPPEESSDFCHRIVLFGRETCVARNPKCGECPLAIHCKAFTGR